MFFRLPLATRHLSLQNASKERRAAVNKRVNKERKHERA
jgi:hypothetical protein